MRTSPKDFDEEGGSTLDQPLSGLDPNHFSSVFEALPDAIILVEHDGRIVGVNARAETLFGYARRDLIGRSIEDLVPERHRGVHRAHRLRYGAAPTIREIGAEVSLVALRSDGTEFPVEIGLSPLPAGAGAAVAASVRDRTERVEREASARRTSLGIDAIRDGVMIFGIDDWRFEYVNRGLAQLSGYGVDELLNDMSVLHLAPKYTRETFRELLEPLASNRVARVELETVMRSRSGDDHPVDVSFEYPVLAGSVDRVVVGVVRDASDRRRSQQSRQRREALTRAVSEMRLLMLGGASRSDGLASVCRAVSETLGDVVAVLVIEAEDEHGLKIEGAHGLSESEMQALTFERDAGLVGEVFRTNDVVWAAGADERMPAANAAVADDLGLGSLLAVPVEAAGGAIGGVLIVGRPTSAEPLGDGDVAALRILAAEAVVAIELADRQVTRQQLVALQARDEIGSILHDRVVGRLFSNGMRLQSLMAEVDDVEVAKRLQRVVEDLDGSIKEIRDTIYGAPLNGDQRDSGSAEA